MTADIATLGLALDSRPIVEGTVALDRLAETSTRVEQKVGVMNGQMNDTAAIMRKNAEASSAASEAAQRFLAPLQREIDLFGASRAETERYNAAKAGLAATTQRQAAALGAAIDALQRDERAAREFAAEQDRAAKAADQFLKKLNDQVAVLGMNTQQLQAYRAAQLGVSDAAAPLIARLGEAGAGAHGAGKHMEGLNFQTVGARRELLVLAHELSQGNFQKFGGSMMVLGEQTGAAGLLFSATGLAALALVATLGGLAYAAIKGALEQKHMNDALVMTGNYAGLTSDSLNNLAHAAVAAGGSIGEAKKVATELAGSGKFTGDQIGYITEATVAWEHATGQSIKSIIKDFESLAVQTTGNSMRATEAISRATIKLDDQYHFLTESVYEQIRALEKEGDAKGASALATETFAKVTHARAEEILHNLGNIAKGWNTIKEVIGAATDAVGAWGARATPAMDVKKYSFKLQQFDEGLVGSNQRLGRPDYQMSESTAAARLAIVMQLTGAVDKLNKADAEGIAQGKVKRTESEAIHAASRIAADDAKLQKKGLSETKIALDQYHDDIAKIKAANPDSILVTPAAVAAHEAAIIKAHTANVKGNDGRAKTLQDALLLEQTGLDREKSIYDSRDKMLSLYHSKFGMSDTEFYAGRANARAEYVAAEAIAFAKESAMVKGYRTKNPEEVAANKAKYDELLRQHLKFVDDMRNAGGEDSANAAGADQKKYDDTFKAIEAAGAAESKRLDDAIAKQKLHNAEIGKTKEQIELAKQAAIDLGTAQLQSDADFIRGAIDKEGFDEKSLAAYQARLSFLDSELAKRREISALLATGANLEAEDKAKKDAAIASRKLADMAIQDWKNVGQSVAESLSSAFGTAGKAAGDMFKAYADNAAKQGHLDKEMALAKVKLDSDPTKLKEIDSIQRQSAVAQMKSYGDMAGAAKGFFKETTKGYKVMEDAEKAFRAYEMVMAIQSMVAKSGLLTAFTGLFAASKATEVAATVATVPVTVAAEGVKQTALATTAMAGAVAVPFPGNIAAFGIVAAMLAAIGLGGFGGGGGADIAKDRQAAAGTGSVFGDSSAKSESISRSIALAATNSSIELTHTAGMLRALLNIQNSISGLGNLLVRGGDVGGALPPDTMGTMSKWATKLDIGPLGGVLGKWTNKITNSIFGGNTTAIDGGLVANKTTVGGVMNGGLHASQYVDTKKDGGWFSSDKYRTQLTALGAEANGQFTKIIANMAAGITEAGKLLGVGGDAFTQRLQGFVVDIGKVSLKGLSGEEIQKQLETVFSKLGDDMAKWAVGGLAPFQKVGEGYLETLVRVASNYANLDSVLNSVGMTFGAVGLSSIAAREDFIAAAGGMDELAGKFSAFSDNFLTEAEKLAPVQKYVTDQLAAMGLQSLTSRDAFKSYLLALDPAADSQRKQIAGLLDLESAFAKAYPATKDFTKSIQEIADERAGLQKQLDQLTLTRAQLLERERSALDASNRGLWDQVKAAQKAKDAQDAAKNSLGDFISKMGNFAASAKTLRDSLMVGSLSTLTPEQQYAQLRRQYESTLAMAKSGDAKAQGDFSSVATAFLTASQKINGGDSQYGADFASVTRTSGEIAQWAAGQVDVAQASLNALNDQVSGISTLNMTMLQVAQSIDSLPADLVATVAQAVLPVDYSRMGSSSNAELLAEIKSLKADLVAEIKGRRADAKQQAGDGMVSNATVTMQAARVVADSVAESDTNARSRDYQVNLHAY